MARIALTEFRKNPRLAQCDPKSVFAAVIQGSQLGLEPGLMGQAYLIPYGKECQLIPGYQGLVDLVRRSGLVRRIEAHVVRDGDKFTYCTGLATILEHEPVLDGVPGEMRLAYAVAEFADGGYHVEVMTRAQIERIRDRSQNVINAKKFDKKTPWDTDTDEMWRKTVLRRICKYLPKSAELATALALDQAADGGAQQLRVEDAIEGTWAPVTEEETGGPPKDTANEERPEQHGAAEERNPVSQEKSVTSEDERKPEWPRKFVDENGEESWQDAEGQIFDPAVHAWSGTQPGVTSAGVFRARRGSRGASNTQPSEPAARTSGDTRDTSKPTGPAAADGEVDPWFVE
jgi:phage RecT family recombinase